MLKVDFEDVLTITATQFSHFAMLNKVELYKRILFE